MLDIEYLDTWLTRKENLNSLEVKEYKDFLLSSIWIELKEKASKRENYKKCYVCGCQDNLELHHLSYKHLNELRNVRSVCRDHHQQIHDFAKAMDLSVRLATRKVRELYNKKR